MYRAFQIQQINQNSTINQTTDLTQVLQFYALIFVFVINFMTLHYNYNVALNKHHYKEDLELSYHYRVLPCMFAPHSSFLSSSNTNLLSVSTAISRMLHKWNHTESILVRLAFPFFWQNNTLTIEPICLILFPSSIPSFRCTII